MVRFIFGFLLGAFFAFVASPYIFPYGFPVAAQHLAEDVRDQLPLVKAYFATP